MSSTVLEVKNLRVAFRSDFGNRVVTDGISFDVRQGETLGLVGESGCGKSVTSLAVMGLLAANGSVDEGEILFEGQDLTLMPEKKLDGIRGKDIAMVYQDALAGLNPVFTVGNQLIEPLRVHMGMSKSAAKDEAYALLKKVGLPDSKNVMRKYPHELSGGQRQRVMIAMALACRPKLLIADEPTTALDVTIQAQIMQLLRGLRADMDMSMILITHDIGLIAQMADRVLVMYAGQFVEEAEVRELFARPMHPYTRALLESAPGIRDNEDRVLSSIRGAVPENYADIMGCRFADRCDFACEACSRPQEITDMGDGHLVRCSRAGDTFDVNPTITKTEAEK